MAKANANTKAAETNNAPAASNKVAPVVIATAKAETKADKARAVFNACYAMDPVPQRKDIIAKMKSEAGLTDAGAATYLQNFKKAAGIVNSKTPAKA